MVKIRFIVLITIFLLLIPIICADTTFFDNPDNMFIYSNPALSAPQPPSGGSGCSYKWNCTDWSECLSSGKQTRTCINIGTCSDRYKILEMNNCTYAALENEEDRELEKEDVSEEKKQEKTEKLSGKEIKGENKMIIYSVTGLIILSIIFYYLLLEKRLSLRK
ncbi:hypothetical protein KY317_01865 [Candidatus Woesearchaeota archaeon]|nr:hypothetical protein [Candidatus Woesearchaeota archaeon]